MPLVSLVTCRAARSLALVACLAVLAMTSVAHAQLAQGSTAPTAPTPVAQPTTSTTVVVQQAPAERAAEPADPVRFRFAIALDGDVLIAPSTVGLAIGLTARFGLQFNQWVGLYYQPHGIVGGWLSADAAGVIAGLFNTANVELTLPFFHLGAGPSLDVLAVAGCGETGAGAGCLANDAVFFGIDGRAAVVIGAIGPGSRGGFSINVHVHPTFVGQSVVTTLSLGVGGELY